MSSDRSPGAVLRVWRILQPVPSTACTYARVAEAMPQARWSRFSIGRSARRIRLRGPRTRPITVPGGTTRPSGARQSIRHSHARATASANAAPATTPPLRYSIRPSASSPTGHREAGRDVGLAVLRQRDGGDALHVRLHRPSATIRSIAPRARAAISGGTVTWCWSSASASRTPVMVIAFM